MPTGNALLDSFAGGLSGLIIGPPKTGKSTLLGSAAELVDPKHIRLLAPKPQEINSFMYERHGLDHTAEVFRDHRWMPSAGIYEADGYQRLLRHILSLYDDDEAYVVLLDPFTDVVTLAGHELLKGEQAASPKEVRNSMEFYGSLRYRLRDVAQALVGLTSKDLKVPKHVFVAVHAQPTKEEDMKGKETTEGKSKGVQFFGDVLPMIEGGYRMDIASEFDIVGYTTVQHAYNTKVRPPVKETSFVVQLRPDEEKHGGLRLSPMLSEKVLPNNLTAILEAVVAARKEGR